jgi:hypothetical protein
MLLELAKGPPQRGPLPASTANAARRNAGVVERRLSLLPTFRAAPSHPADSTDREDVHPFRAAGIDCHPHPCEEHAESTDGDLLAADQEVETLRPLPRKIANSGT